MNTVSIEKFLRIALARSDYAECFLGALPKDYAARVLKRTRPGERFCMVANTQTSTQAGEHWVAYFYDGRTLEFFDSYGNHPTDLRMPTLTNVVWNHRTIQSWDSDVCGQYCVYYLCKRAFNVSLRSLINPFSSDLRSNDAMVASFVCRKFKLCSRSNSKCSNSVCNQSCVSRKYCGVNC